MPDPKLSVVIPTYNRDGLLKLALDSLNRLDIPRDEWEVIVVDDGSTDSTPHSLASRQDRFALKILRREKSQGPSAARNWGGREARGEILGFLDSDVVVGPGWWRAAASLFDDPLVAAVEGAALPPADSAEPTPFMHVVANIRGGSYQTCNFFCRRSAFLQVGGFDERYCWPGRRRKIWHHREDTDLAFAFLHHHWKIAFAAQAVVYHPLVPAPRDVYLKRTYFGLQEMLLWKKYPRLYARQMHWINGRIIPVFFWGVLAGVPMALAGGAVGSGVLVVAGALGFLVGWAGSVYAVCRKRRTTVGHLALLVPQFLIIPWLGIFWVLAGLWKFRRVHPVPQSAEEGKPEA